MRWLLIALTASGCASPPSPRPLPSPDPLAFAAAVQPLLDGRCADPSCHGRPERALSLYSPLHFRSDPRHTYLDEPLDEEELRHNVRMLVAFLVDLPPGTTVDDCLVLRKPLALAAGGCDHLGGAQFPSRDERGYRQLRSWFAGAAAGAP